MPGANALHLATMSDILNVGQKRGIYIHAMCHSMISEIKAALSGNARAGLLLYGLR